MRWTRHYSTTRCRCGRSSDWGLRPVALMSSPASVVLHPDSVDLLGLLRALVDRRIEFLVVGGGAAVLQGAPVTTFDLDIVPRRDPENAAALLQLLEEHGVYIIEPMKRQLRPRATDFLGAGQLNLSTDKSNAGFESKSVGSEVHATTTDASANLILRAQASYALHKGDEEAAARETGVSVERLRELLAG